MKTLLITILSLFTIISTVEASAETTKLSPIAQQIEDNYGKDEKAKKAAQKLIADNPSTWSQLRKLSKHPGIISYINALELHNQLLASLELQAITMNISTPNVIIKTVPQKKRATR